MYTIHINRAQRYSSEVQCRARHLVSWAKGGWAEDQGGWAKGDNNAQQKWTIMLQVKGNIVQKYHIKSI